MEDNHLPIVTIGIPIYNEEKYISETLLSAINQTYRNLQILISDNCSTDNTFEIITKIGEKYGNVHIVRQEKNIGSIGNFNYLVENSKTELFCWLSGHDILHKEYISSAVEVHLNNPNITLVYPQSQQIDANGDLMNIESYSKIDTTKLDYLYGPLKVVKTLTYGTPIHGVFKTQFLKKNKVKPIIGSDFIILYQASLSGKILELPTVYHFLREFRKETVNETYQRYSEFGISSNYKNPCTEMCKEYLRYTWRSDKINFFQKTKLLFKLTIVLKRRYNWPRLRFLSYFYTLFKKVMNKIIKMLS
jgi:glycosyltransferase involved in cell wall biosynthesis